MTDRTTTEDAEDNRVRAAYARRRQTIPPERYARTNPFTLCAAHEREEEMAAMFRAEGLTTLAGWRRGDALRQMLEYGADPELLTGIDLLDENVKRAHRLSPHLRVICGSASRMPFPDASFDLVMQFTLFTSILNDEVKQAIASEMIRVLAPGGRILWYDFSFNNPKNPDVRGIGKQEIRSLFPNLEMKVKRITLAPPLGRKIAPMSPVLYYLLSRVRPLCTHLLSLMRKPCDLTL